MRLELFWIIAAAFALTALLLFSNALLHPTKPLPPSAEVPSETATNIEAHWQALLQAIQTQGLDASLVQEARRALQEGRLEEAIGAWNAFVFLLDGWERAGRLSPSNAASLRRQLHRLLDALAPSLKGAPLCVGLYETEAGETRLVGPLLREAPPAFRLRLGPQQEWTWHLQEPQCF